MPPVLVIELANTNKCRLFWGHPRPVGHASILLMNYLFKKIVPKLTVICMFVLFCYEDVLCLYLFLHVHINHSRCLFVQMEHGLSLTFIFILLRALL